MFILREPNDQVKEEELIANIFVLDKELQVQHFVIMRQNTNKLESNGHLLERSGGVCVFGDIGKNTVFTGEPGKA